jgi:hypothetical protein
MELKALLNTAANHGREAVAATEQAKLKASESQKAVESGDQSFATKQLGLEAEALQVQSQELAQSQDKIYQQFIKEYTAAKTMNTHFGYGLPNKSLLEQASRKNRFLHGMLTYFRGRMEMQYRQMVQPLFEAGNNKDWRKAVQSAFNIVSFVTGSYLAHKVSKDFLGFEAYGIVEDNLRYTPLSPGLSALGEASNTFSQIIAEGARRGDPTPETVARGVRAVLSTGDGMVPFMKSITSFYESQEGVYGVNFVRLVEKQLEGESIFVENKQKFKKFDRTTFQSILHFLTGGFEQPDPSEANKGIFKTK